MNYWQAMSRMGWTMATIADLATLAPSSVGSGDYLVISDSGTDKKIDATLVPWTTTASTFTRMVNVASANTSDHGFNANMPAGATTVARAFRWALDGTARGWVQTDSANNEMNLQPFDNGAGDGPNIVIGRNSNASTPSAGYLQLQNRANTGYRIWPDATGLLRIHTADPTNANDAAGTVIGAQTSSLDAKTLLGAPVDGAAALLHIAEGAAAVRRFTYKNGSYNGEEFSGLVVDYAPRYGMDRDEKHPAGKSLNVVTVIGDLMIAVTHLAERVAALEAAHV